MSKMQFEAVLTLSGDSLEDVLLALDEARSKIEDGYNVGFDSNDTGSYNFHVKEDPALKLVNTELVDELMNEAEGYGVLPVSLQYLQPHLPWMIHNLNNAIDENSYRVMRYGDGGYLLKITGDGNVATEQVKKLLSPELQEMMDAAISMGVEAVKFVKDGPVFKALPVEGFVSEPVGGEKRDIGQLIVEMTEHLERGVALSTDHLEKDDLDNFNEFYDGAVSAREPGWFVNIGEGRDSISKGRFERLSDTMQDIVKAAQAAGFSLIEFDRDAEMLPSLAEVYGPR